MRRSRSFVVVLAVVAVAGVVSYPHLRRLIAAIAPRGLDINLDHGLADCPWPKGVDPLDPGGEARVEDRNVVLRTNDRIYLSERVVSVTCYSAYLFGPAILIELRADAPPERHDPAPPLDPKIDRSRDDLPAALAAYRVALRVMDQFGLTEEEAARGKQSLEQWYGEGNHNLKGSASLGYVGTLASGAVEVLVFHGPTVVVSFSFRTEVNAASALADISRRDGGMPADFLERPPPPSRICIWMPKDGGPSWQPPARSQAEIDKSWFKPCPE